jgi:thiol:disulfide interchange protein DsbD
MATFLCVLKTGLSRSLCLLGLWFFGALCLPAQQARVELLSDRSAIVPGEAFTLAVRIELDPDWHLYWRNPGASGLPLELEWNLPPGLQAGPIEWAVPQKISVGGLVNYVYKQSAVYLIRIQSSQELVTGTQLPIRVKAFWLMCKELCLPDEADLKIDLAVATMSQASPEAALIAESGRQLPLKSNLDSIRVKSDAAAVHLWLGSGSSASHWSEGDYFFPYSSEWMDPNQPQSISEEAQRLSLPLKTGLTLPEDGRLQGVLLQAGEYRQVDLPLASVSQLLQSQTTNATQANEGLEQSLLSWGLLGMLILAFLGGLILNVMPCVLPVLSLKVFSLLQHCGQSKRQVLVHGLAYTLGVVLSFVFLAAVLFILRALGEQVGWGFQLQNPSFVTLLALFFFGFALNMLGVFEFGSRLVGADSKLSQRSDWIGSLGMGVLAAVVGAPCMGPLLASVSGVAVQTSVARGLLLFATMGFGLAAPFLFLSTFPKLINFLPKPGVWMESLKQFMGFLLLAAVLFLVWVLATQVGLEAVISLLLALWLLALAAWLYGRWAAPVKSQRSRRLASACSLLILISALWSALAGVQAKKSDHWEPWSEVAVENALLEGRPIFIDFTASWCVICQVNKKVALRTEATQALFEKANVALFEADWTSRDPAISRALEVYGRSGVPLYILQFPGEPAQILPQNLTVGIIRAALQVE